MAPAWPAHAQAKGYGAPELVTCGRDGCVRVWDVRQHDAPVAAFEPADSSNIRDCWCVAFGNSYNDEERCVLAGYDNGDVKMFDLRMNKVCVCEHGVDAAWRAIHAAIHAAWEARARCVLVT
eukprot:350426-Chlamydomonas_euryale.AAC.7